VTRPRIYLAEEEDILAGKVTDVYFVRTALVTEATNVASKRVAADVHAYSLPSGYGGHFSRASRSP